MSKPNAKKSATVPAREKTGTAATTHCTPIYRTPKLCFLLIILTVGSSIGFGKLNMLTTVRCFVGVA